MIVLDSNVVSELMKPEPEARVVRFVDAHPPKSVYVTAIAKAEILYGVARLPIGVRRQRLNSKADLAFAVFADRVLPFTATTASEYAEIASDRAAAGQPISTFDAMIAAICRERGYTLVTRNTKDFADTGFVVVNPWI